MSLIDLGNFIVYSLLIIGTLKSGIGKTHLNKELSAANVSIMYNFTFKRSESKAGESIEFLADKSCLQSLEIERALTIEKEG